MSYANTIMYSSVIPSYDSKKKDEKEEKFNSKLDANNPDNFKNIKGVHVVKG